MDDELPGLTYLRMLCESIGGIEIVRAFNDPLKLLEEKDKYDFDLCILDIEMPGLNGLEVAALLGRKPVIFTTAYKEYAAEAFDLDAIDYIRKPIQRDRLEKAIQKAQQKIAEKNTSKTFFQWNTNKGKAVIFFDQVLYITTADTDKRDKTLVMEGNTQIILKNISFEQVLEELPPKEFCRVSKKDIVAMKAVRFFSSDEITLALSPIQDLKINLNETYRLAFLQHFNPR